VVVPWKSRHRARLELSAEREIRDFTTSNPFDLLRWGRTDHRWEYQVEVVQQLSRALDLSAEWRRDSNDALFAPGVVPSDDITDFVEDRFTLGLHYRIGAR